MKTIKFKSQYGNDIEIRANKTTGFKNIVKEHIELYHQSPNDPNNYDTDAKTAVRDQSNIRGELGTSASRGATANPSQVQRKEELQSEIERLKSELV